MTNIKNIVGMEASYNFNWEMAWSTRNRRQLYIDIDETIFSALPRRFFDWKIQCFRGVFVCRRILKVVKLKPKKKKLPDLINYNIRMSEEDKIESFLSIPVFFIMFVIYILLSYIR